MEVALLPVRRGADVDDEVDIVDQLAQAAGRVRGVLDDLRPAASDELRVLRDAVTDLQRRVDALEARPPASPSDRGRSPSA